MDLLFLVHQSNENWISYRLV